MIPLSSPLCVGGKGVISQSAVGSHSVTRKPFLKMKVAISIPPNTSGGLALALNSLVETIQTLLPVVFPPSASFLCFN